MAEVELKKTLTLSHLIFYGVGTILGLGIYVLIGKIAGEAGMFAPFSFAVAAILALFTGISYGELGARIPKSAGEVNFVDEAFGKYFLSSLIGWMIITTAIISTSAIVNGYVGYVHLFVEWPSWIIIVVMICVLGGVAIIGIKQSAWVVATITIIEIIGIIMVIVVGSDYLADIPERFDELIPQFKFDHWTAVMAGAFLAFFAFIGFEDLVNLSEESKNPRRDIPKSVIISLVVITVLYILVALVASLALTPEQLNESSAPLADIMATKGTLYPKIIGLIGLVAILNGVLVQIIMCTRVMHGMGKLNMAPKLLSQVNPKTQTPIWGTLITLGVVLILALSFEIKGLAKATNYVILTVFVFVNLSLIFLKRKNPKPAGIKTYPTFVPYVGFIFSLFVLIMEVLSNF